MFLNFYFIILEYYVQLMGKVNGNKSNWFSWRINYRRISWFNKAMEEKFGVSYTAPVMMAGPAAAAGEDENHLWGAVLTSA